MGLCVGKKNKCVKCAVGFSAMVGNVSAKASRNGLVGKAVCFRCCCSRSLITL